MLATYVNDIYGVLGLTY